MYKGIYLGQSTKFSKDKIEITVYYKNRSGDIKSSDFVVYIKEK